MTRSMRKYLTLTKCGILTRLAYPASLAGTATAIFVYMYVFFELWSYTLNVSAAPVLAGMGLKPLLWYLLATEIMVLSQISVASSISASIRDGSIAITLGKPVNLGLYSFFLSFGESLPLFSVNALIGGLTTVLLVGPLSAVPPGNVLCFLLLGFCGVVLNFLISYSIGLLAIIIEDTSSLEWIYSKLLLIIGGALMPLDFFPSGIKNILDYLPFSAIIYKPAMTLVGKNIDGVVHTLAIQGVWIVIATSGCALLYRKLIAEISINGG